MRVCKEAGRDPNHRLRPAPHPGPRCATCHRRVVKERKLVAANRRVEAVYGLTGAEYAALYLLQGGRCAICPRATGKTKRLAVDHNHKCAAGHPPNQGCRECVRGLLCGPCNRFVGIMGDSPELFEKAAQYLRNPPARKMLGGE